MAVGKLYERHGKMMTIKEIAAETGLSIESVRRQIKKKGDATLVGRDESKILPPLMNGKQYSWSELGRMAGVSGETMRHRIRDIGMSVEEAITHKKCAHFRSDTANEKIRCSESVKQDILKAWDCGEKSIEDVARMTKCPIAVISVVLPVDEILEQERRDILRKFGYRVKGR